MPLFIIAIILTSLNFSSFAQVSNFCDDQQFDSCALRLNPSIPEPLLVRIENSVHKLEWMQQNVRRLKNADEIRLFETEHFLKSLEKTPTVEPHATQVQDYRKGVAALFEILWSANSLQKSIPILSPGQRPEVEDRIRKLQTAKIGVLLKYPLLAHPKVEKYLQKNLAKTTPDKFSVGLNDKDLYTLLKDSLGDLKTALKKQIEDCDAFLSIPQPDVSKATPFEKKATQELLDRLPYNYSGLVDRVLEAKALDAKNLTRVERVELCDLENNAKKAKTQRQVTELVAEGGLLTLSLMGSPIGRSIGWLTGVGSSRLLSWGVSGLGTAGTAALTLNELSKVKNECLSRFASFQDQAQKQQLVSLQDCHEQLGNKIIQASILPVTAIMPVAAVSLKSTILAARSIPHLSKEVALEGSAIKNFGAVRFEGSGGHYTHYDLAHKQLVEPKKFQKMTDDFFDFARQTFLDRQIVTAAETESFIKISREFASRTQFIIHSAPVQKGSEVVEQIQGGMGIVRSHHVADLLPLEKSLGIRVDRSQGSVAELTKLTVSKDAPKDISTEIMRQAETIVSKDPSLAYVYIYTSKAHARMYRRGRPYIEEDQVLNERDVLLKINIAEMRKGLYRTEAERGL